MSTKAKPEGEVFLNTRDGGRMAVPAEGNLGLLAAGYRGLMIWREVRAASGWTTAKATADARSAFKSQRQLSVQTGQTDQTPE